MTRTLLLIAALSAATPACDDGGGARPARGFGSRQLSSLRDSTFSFEGAQDDLVLYSVGSPPSYWSIDAGTGSVVARDSTFSDLPPWDPRGAPADPNARFRCSYGASPTGGLQLRIDDLQTGQTTAIDDVGFFSRCPSESDPTLTVWRRDGNGRLGLWSGRFDDLHPAPVDLAVVQILQVPETTRPSFAVLAGRAAQPDALGIYAVAAATFEITELVPPVLVDGAWADGATPAGALDSPSLFADSNAYLAGVVPMGDHFRYWRVMADGGGPTLFVGPLAAGSARERALFRRDGYTPEQIAVAPADETFRADPPLPTVWQRADGASDASELLVWDDVRHRLVTCTAPLALRAIAAASGDRNRLALFFRVPGPLVLANLLDAAGGGNACSGLATEVSAAGFAPDDSALFWLKDRQDEYGNAELWLAGSDGSAPRLVGADRIAGPPDAPHFVGASQLELELVGDLVWIDTHDDPVRTHAIAERVSGSPIERGRWLIVGYDASEQDGTARLGVVNRDTGAKRLISADVQAFISPDVRDPASGKILPSTLRKAGDPIRVVYLVRGRNPSPQDGLWVATINASDIP